MSITNNLHGLANEMILDKEKRQLVRTDPKEIGRILQSQQGLAIGPVIGKGQQSTVYRIMKNRKKTQAALKVFHYGMKSDPNQGSHVVAGINHPGILSPQAMYYKHLNGKISCTPSPDAHCIAILLPYIKGVPLKDYGARERAKDIFQLGLDLIQAVQTLQMQSIAHNDLHDENIMVTKDNKPVLIDFDLATKKEYEPTHSVNKPEKDVQDVIRNIETILMTSTKNGRTKPTARAFISECLRFCEKPELTSEDALKYLLGLCAACLAHLEEISPSPAPQITKKALQSKL